MCDNSPTSFIVRPRSAFAVASVLLFKILKRAEREINCHSRYTRDESKYMNKAPSRPDSGIFSGRCTRSNSEFRLDIPTR